MKRELFKELPEIGPDQPMIDTDFWAFLDSQRENRGTFVDALKAYGARYGFDITLHVLPEDQVKAHRFVYSHFGWTEARKVKD